MWVQGVGITLDKTWQKAKTWKSETKTTTNNNNNNNLFIYLYSTYLQLIKSYLKHHTINSIITPAQANHCDILE